MPTYVKAKADAWFQLGTDEVFTDQEIATILVDQTVAPYRIVHAGVQSLRKYDTITSATTLRAEADRLDAQSDDAAMTTLDATQLRSRADEMIATLAQ